MAKKASKMVFFMLKYPFSKTFSGKRKILEVGLAFKYPLPSSLPPGLMYGCKRQNVKGRTANDGDGEMTAF